MRLCASVMSPGRGRAVGLIVLAAACRAGAAEPDGPVRPVPVTDDVIVDRPLSAEAVAAADLRVRYAMARLRLAELDLERALAANRALPAAVGPREIERLRNHVRLLERHVEIARDQPRTAARQATVAAAEAGRDNVRADLEAALAANHRVPGAVSELNVKRLRARLELAEIRIALCKNPDYELSILDEMQWNIDQLTDQLIDLRHQVETGGSGDIGKPK